MPGMFLSCVPAELSDLKIQLKNVLLCEVQKTPLPEPILPYTRHVYIYTHVHMHAQAHTYMHACACTRVQTHKHRALFPSPYNFKSCA